MKPDSTAGTYNLYIGGEWIPSIEGKTMASENPYSGQEWASIQDARESDVDLGACRT